MAKEKKAAFPLDAYKSMVGLEIAIPKNYSWRSN
jgi:hypothetical protein